MVLRWLSHRWGGQPADVLPATVQFGPIDLQSLGPLEQGLLMVGLTVLVGTLVVGLLPGYGNRIVRTTHRSPIISLCIGAPLASVLGSLTYVGYLLSDSSLGVFFAIPLLTVCLTLLIGWGGAGFVALGGFLTRRFGVEQTWAWTLLGGLLGGSIALSFPVGAVVFALAASLGVGAGARVTLNGGGVTTPEERVVPPANKV